MSTMEDFISAKFFRVDEANKDKFCTLVKAVEEVESFFLREKEGALYKFLLEVIEKPLIENVLSRTEGNKLKAAKILGINRNTLHTKIKKLKINVNDFKEGGLKMSG